MTNKISIGIDGGFNGAICALKNGKIEKLIVMPIMESTDSRSEYDCNKIIEFLSQYKDATVYLEKAHAMPLLGTVQAFNFGKSFGIMIGILSTLKLPYHIIHAKTWQSRLFKDQPHGDTKKASAIIAQRLFPGIEFRATERSKKVHDGMTDATLIAHYGDKYI